MAVVKKVVDGVSAWTEKTEGKYLHSKFNNVVGEVSAGTEAIVSVAGKATLLTLSKAWLGVGLVRPANTEERKFDPTAANSLQSLTGQRTTTAFGDAWYDGTITSQSGLPLDRFDYERLFSLQLGDYFMPLSQTFDVRASKQLNTSPLVDGIDVIQQTRKHAKTIDCTLRLSLRDNQPNLQIVNADNEVQRLAWFLNELYETDMVFAISNDTINNTHGITHVIMSKYRYVPKPGMGTYNFEFSLTEVKYGENVLTFDLTQVNSAPNTLTGN